MNAPPGPTDHQQQPDLGANHEGRSADFLSLPVLMRTARVIAHRQGLRISGSRMRKIVRRFIDEGRPDADFHAWFLDYSDPTGETAVRHVMGGRRTETGGGS